jgi:hypothetical protein
VDKRKSYRQRNGSLYFSVETEKQNQRIVRNTLEEHGVGGKTNSINQSRHIVNPKQNNKKEEEGMTERWEKETERKTSKSKAIKKQKS